MEFDSYLERFCYSTGKSREEAVHLAIVREVGYSYGLTDDVIDACGYLPFA